MEAIKSFINKAGVPRIIIGLFLLILFILAPFVKLSLAASLSDTVVRWGMNAVLVLSLIPMIRSGCGLNFGLSLGIIAGLLGAVMSIEFNLTGPMGFFGALLFAIPFAVLLGWLYGLLLNRVKGDEMMVSTYVGFSSVAFMCIMWLVLPFKNPTMVWAYGGSGLRTTISVEKYWIHSLSDFLSFKIGDFYFPTGMIIFFIIMALIVWAFFKTKLGTSVAAVGSNPEYAIASGVNIDKMRTVSVIFSTVLSAIGIVVYQQSFGFIQLYLGPFYMPFPAVAAILIGGASVVSANITNVIIGTFLFQGILTMTPSVMNSLIQTDISESVRIIISNGMILYALTRVKKAKK